MKKDIFVKRCLVCKKTLRHYNLSSLCYRCYNKQWGRTVKPLNSSNFGE